jgi:hypothetical protein
MEALGPPALAVQDGRLLAEGEVLKCQFRAGPQCCWILREQPQGQGDHARGVSGPEAQRFNDINRAGVLGNDRPYTGNERGICDESPPRRLRSP